MIGCLGRVSLRKFINLTELLTEEHNKEILAAHRNDDPLQELPAEARQSLEEFKDYILKNTVKNKNRYDYVAGSYFFICKLFANNGDYCNEVVDMPLNLLSLAKKNSY